MSTQDSLFQEPGQAGSPSSTPGGSTPFSAKPAGAPDTAAQLKLAERQVSNLLVLLLVVSGTLCIFLLQEVRYARADLTVLRTQQQQLSQARQVIAEYNTKSVPAITQFLNQLTEYSRTHPDVLPIMAKYGLVQARPAEPGGSPPQGP